MADRRRKTLVDEFQHRLILRMIVYWLVCIITLGNVLFCLQLLAEGPGNLIEQFGRFAYRTYPILLCLLAVLPVFLWDSVRFYHKVAGPLRRIQSSLQCVAAGKPVQLIKVREGDALHEIVADLNSMFEKLASDGSLTVASTSSSRKPTPSRREAAPSAATTAEV